MYVSFGVCEFISVLFTDEIWEINHAQRLNKRCGWNRFDNRYMFSCSWKIRGLEMRRFLRWLVNIDRIPDASCLRSMEHSARSNELNFRFFFFLLFLRHVERASTSLTRGSDFVHKLCMLLSFHSHMCSELYILTSALYRRLFPDKLLKKWASFSFPNPGLSTPLFSLPFPPSYKNKKETSSAQLWAIYELLFFRKLKFLSSLYWAAI